MHREQLQLSTPGRVTVDITQAIQAVVDRAGVASGMCNVFVKHTSASLMICENADPDVRSDLERFMAKLAPDGDSMFEHVAEGPDDMPAHVRSVLTQSSISVPVEASRCALGTWQGLYLWEHRLCAHRRTVTVTVIGE